MKSTQLLLQKSPRQDVTSHYVEPYLSELDPELADLRFLANSGRSGSCSLPSQPRPLASSYSK